MAGDIQRAIWATLIVRAPSCGVVEACCGSVMRRRPVANRRVAQGPMLRARHAPTQRRPARTCAALRRSSRTATAGTAHITRGRLQIVDNLHAEPSNRNMLKTENNAGRAAAPHARAKAARAAAADPRARRHDRGAAVQFAPHAGAARTRAAHPRRRLSRRQQAQRGGDRRPARRVARPGARGVPRAGGVRSRPPREESRRVRAPDRRRGSRRDLRAARGARRVRRHAGSRRASRRWSTCAACARWSTAWTAPSRATTSTPTMRRTSNSTTRWSRSPATASCSPPTGASSTNCISIAARRSRRRAPCPCRRASTTRSSTGSRAGQAAAAGAALYDHVMRSRERMQSRPRRRRDGRRASRRAVRRKR